MSSFAEDKLPNLPINGGKSDGPDHFPASSTDSHREDHRTAASLLPSSSCYPITLKFVDVCYRVKLESKSTAGGSNRSGLRQLICGDPKTPAPERTILRGISGVAAPGDVLAVLGPSGSGKSTLLNALAGRLHGHALTGAVFYNGKKLTGPVLRRTGFVAQDDVLYPHLTVRETLVFCALLRLPISVARKEKVAAAEAVMAELGLAKCENTIIGNGFIRGVSGGERKRVSIAHEMLVNPSLLILDEPTSGLDSTAAFRVAATLGAVAKKGGKTVVASMHQPSSRVFQMFDAVLLLSQGTSLYFGKATQAMTYFQSIGFSPPFPMNPADFLLDLANGVCHLDSSTTEISEKPSIRKTLISSYSTLLAPRVTAQCSKIATTTTGQGIVVVGKRGQTTQPHPISTATSTWLTQFTVLLHRSLKERRHESFNSLRVLQVVSAALLSGAMWWRSGTCDVQDRLGLLFFLSIFWGVFPSFNAVFAFPQDRAIFLKERASGMYTLLPYFMARVIGDLPMDLILPTLFTSLTYFMAGLRPGPGPFLLTLVVVLGYVLVAQGLGLAVGALIMDGKRASTMVTLIMLAFVLTGGFYVHKMPAWLAWAKYMSITFYGYRLLILVQYGQGHAVWTELGCSHAVHGSSMVRDCKFIEEDIAGQMGAMACVLILGFMFVGYRLIAYLALRRIRL